MVSRAASSFSVILMLLLAFMARFWSLVELNSGSWAGWIESAVEADAGMEGATWMLEIARGMSG